MIGNRTHDFPFPLTAADQEARTLSRTVCVPRYGRSDCITEISPIAFIKRVKKKMRETRPPFLFGRRAGPIESLDFRRCGAVDEGEP